MIVPYESVEVMWLRQHLPMTQTDVTDLIYGYTRAMIDVAAADAQTGHDAEANAAAARAQDLVVQIKTACTS